MSDIKTIVALLDTVASSLPEQARPDTWPAWVDPVRHDEVARELSRSGVFSEFDDQRMQMFGASAIRVSLRNLAVWMVQRAVSVGGERSVQDVLEYLNSDDISADAVMLLTGLPLDEEFDLGAGMKLIPIDALANEQLRTALISEQFSSLPLPKPTGALLCRIDLPRRHYAQSEDRETRERTHVPVDRLEDARLCLTMSRSDGCGVQAIATTFVASDATPILGGWSWGMHEYVPFQITPSLTAFEASKARAAHETFLALDEAHRARLRVPLSRLNRVSATRDHVERAVALRTALEALFLDDPARGELAYRLALRAALFTESDVEARKHVRRLIPDLYDVCSAAVHMGRLPTKEGKKTKLSPRDQIKEGRRLALKALEARLREPTVNWADLEILGELPTDNRGTRSGD